MNVASAPSEFRRLRIVTTIGLAFLALIQTPLSITRAGLGATMSERYWGALAIGLVVLIGIGAGYHLLTKVVQRTADHQLVARYVSDNLSVVAAAAKLVGYVLVVVLAVGFAVTSFVHLLNLETASVPVIQSIVILVLAVPSFAGWQPRSRTLFFAMVPAALAIVAVLVAGLFLELVDGIDSAGHAAGGIAVTSTNAGVSWPLGEAALGACLPAALIGLMTERSFGEATTRRIEVRALLKVLIPTLLLITATIYLVQIATLSPTTRLSPILVMAEMFLGGVAAAVAGIAFCAGGLAIGLAAYSQVNLLLRSLATDGILPRQMAAADARAPRRFVVSIIAVLCAGAAYFAETSLGVSTSLVLILFACFVMTMAALVARGRKVRRDSTVLAERNGAKASIRWGLLLGVMALVIILISAVVQPGHTLIAVLVLAVPSVVLLAQRRGRGKIGKTLAASDLTEGRTLPTRVHAIVLVERLDRPTLQAITYARATRPSTLAGLVVDVDPATTEALSRDWTEAEMPVELRILGTPRGAARRPVIEHVRSLRAGSPRDIVIIYAPRVVSSSAAWQRFFVRHSTPALLSELKLEPGVIVAEVPYQLEDVEEQ